MNVPLLTIWKTVAMTTAKRPTPKKMSKAVLKLTVGFTPNVQPGKVMLPLDEPSPWSQSDQ